MTQSLSMIDIMTLCTASRISYDILGILCSVPAFWTIVWNDVILKDLDLPPIEDMVCEELDCAVTAEESCIWIDERIVRPDSHCP